MSMITEEEKNWSNPDEGNIYKVEYSATLFTFHGGVYFPFIDFSRQLSLGVEPTGGICYSISAKKEKETNSPAGTQSDGSNNELTFLFLEAPVYFSVRFGPEVTERTQDKFGFGLGIGANFNMGGALQLNSSTTYGVTPCAYIEGSMRISPGGIAKLRLVSNLTSQMYENENGAKSTMNRYGLQIGITVF